MGKLVIGKLVIGELVIGKLVIGKLVIGELTVFEACIPRPPSHDPILNGRVRLLPNFNFRFEGRISLPRWVMGCRTRDGIRQFSNLAGRQFGGRIPEAPIFPCRFFWHLSEGASPDAPKFCFVWFHQ
ncbi:MAG: hypothetical protein ACK4I8_03080 [Armatimonadota bacterium]